MQGKHEPSGLHEKNRIPDAEVIHLGSREFDIDLKQGSLKKKKKTGCFVPFLIVIAVLVCIGGAFFAGLMLDGNSIRSSQFYSRMAEKLSFLSPDEPVEEEEFDFFSPSAAPEASETLPADNGFFEPSGKSPSGRAYESNVGLLNSSVKEGSREKFTQLVGGGKDSVTVMIYICGGDLEAVNGMASDDIKEILSARTGKNLNVLLCTGGTTKWRTKGINAEKIQLFKVENGELVPIQADMGSGAMTDAATLFNFLRYCGWQYPANRNILILRDHGGSVLTGFGYDKNHPESGAMSLSELDRALADAQMSFDIIGFDASLMASCETAVVLSRYADYMIASEALMPASGWFYTDWITRLNNYSSVSSINLGKQIIDDCIEHSTVDAALSLVDLAEFSAYMPDKLKDFAAAAIRQFNSGEYGKLLSARIDSGELICPGHSDQVDLVRFARDTGLIAGRNLALGALSTIKYNRTSDDCVNVCGLSLYSPFYCPEKVQDAVTLYNVLGLDPVCSRFISALAAIESAARSVTPGESYSAYSSMLGKLSGSTVYGSGTPGGYTSVLAVLNELISDEQKTDELYLDKEKAAAYINENRFFPSQMFWTKTGDSCEMVMTEDNLRMLSSITRNVFYNNGNGFVDLGEDLSQQFSDNGKLKADFDGKWLAINGQPVPFHRLESLVRDDGSYRVTGRIPVLYNAMRADLIAVFDNEHPDGYIAGVCYNYANGETDTFPKVLSGVRKGVRIDFLCGFYDYGGTYVDNYKFGERIIPEEDLKLSRVSFADSSSLLLTYKFTDIYGQSYWSPVVP